MPRAYTTSNGPTKDGWKNFEHTLVNQSLIDVLCIVNTKLPIFALKHQFNVMI